MVVQIARLQDGSRKIISIAEVIGVKDDQIEIQDIFIFDRTGVSDAGKVQGNFRSTGVKPQVMERLRVSGLEVPGAVFEEVVPVNL